MDVRETSYPTPDQAGFIGALEPGERFWLLRHSLRHRMEAMVKQALIERRLALSRIEGRSTVPLAAADMPLLVPVHDDMRYLPSFLAHYRSLGVTRFIMVDDRSRDGTRDFLLAQPDVDLWESNLRFGEVMRGRGWREWLVRHYGRGRWYVTVDSDEYLVYPGSDAGVRLPEFIARLEARGQDRCAAPMIDAYYPGPLRDAVFTGRDGRMPWDVATHIDGSGYRLLRADSALNVIGGVRPRVFGSRVDLMKYPLLRWDMMTSFGASIHRPMPFYRNYAPISGILLHFKLFSDLHERAERAVSDNQYYDGAREYRRFRDVEAIEDVSLAGDVSIPYSGPADLVRRGFMVA